MKKQIYISKVNKNVVDFIKQSIDEKKEMHKRLIESVNPSIVNSLKKMKKVEFCQK